MSRMEPVQRERLQLLQEGLSGAKPMDASWIQSTVDTVKTQPETIKTMLHGRGAMLGGFSDEQLDGFIDSASRLDEGTLKWGIGTLVFLGSLVKPTIEAYKHFDKYTLGLANYLIGIVLAFALYFYVTFSWMVIKWLYAYFFAKSIAASAAAAGASASGAGAASSPVAAASSGAGFLAFLGFGAKRIITPTVTSSAASDTATANGARFDAPPTTTTTATTTTDLEDF